MPANCEYTVKNTDALWLTPIAQADQGQRITQLSEYSRLNGELRLIELFAQFIGMANAVAENCSEMSDQVLIEECGVHPDKFTGVNMPNMIGALQGVVLASGCSTTGACHGCAYRLGSIANQSPITTADAAYMAFERKGFMCHAHTGEDGEPIKFCVGHAKAHRSAATQPLNPA